MKTFQKGDDIFSPKHTRFLTLDEFKQSIL